MSKRVQGEEVVDEGKCPSFSFMHAFTIRIFQGSCRIAIRDVCIISATQKRWALRVYVSFTVIPKYDRRCAPNVIETYENVQEHQGQFSLWENTMKRAR